MPPLLSNLIITKNTAMGSPAIAAMHSSVPIIQNTQIFGNTSISYQYIIRFHNLVYGAQMKNVTIADNFGAKVAIDVTRGSTLQISNSIIYNPSGEMELWSNNGDQNRATLEYCNVRGEKKFAGD